VSAEAFTKADWLRVSNIAGRGLPSIALAADGTASE
jgi:hypothetical protein